MTYAPATILALRTFLTPYTGLSASSLGIVGDAAHATRPSYHNGRDRMLSRLSTDYSCRTARDKAGLNNAASALDIGNFKRLRSMSVWLVAQARANAPGTGDIREIIYSPDGVKVLRWDRERGYASLPRTGEADGSHLWHTHISWYRDSEKHDKIGVFRPFFVPVTVNVWWAIDIRGDIKAAYTAKVVASKLKALKVPKFLHYGEAGWGRHNINYSDLEAGLKARGIGYGTSVQLIDVKALMA